MKVLLTGGTGFIGRHLAKALSLTEDVRRLSRNQDVYYSIDIKDAVSVKDVLNSYKPDAIVHLAGNPSSKLDDNNPTLISQDNIIGTQNLLHYAPEGCRFIFASSVLVYGDTPDHVSEVDICRPTSVYGATKLAGEALVSAYTKMGRVNGVSLRLCATVGKGLTHGIVYDIIKKLYSDSPNLQLLGAKPGTAKPYIHVRDVCDCVYDLLHTTKDINGVFNISNEDILTAERIGKIISDAFEINKPIEFLGENSIWKGDNNKLLINSSLAKSLIFRPVFHTSKMAMSMAAIELHDDIMREQK